MRAAYKGLEQAATGRLLGMLPLELQPDYAPLMSPEDPEVVRLVKAADKLCAYLKVVQEVAVGNREFAAAKTALRDQLKALAPEGSIPEVEHFLREFEYTFTRSLDELQAHDERAD